MPLFEFKCKQCGAVFEKLVFSSATNQPVKCHKCGSTETQKLLSTFAARTQGGSSSGGSSSGGSCGSSGFS
ncbi:MAG: zinc ribbon domain-containing protein [Calditrichaeota bacterium]|nr:MAG: zinc ribbon domain-containing protein [Calditrichota bacterium]